MSAFLPYDPYVHLCYFLYQSFYKSIHLSLTHWRLFYGVDNSVKSWLREAEVSIVSAHYMHHKDIFVQIKRPLLF